MGQHENEQWGGGRAVNFSVSFCSQKLQEQACDRTNSLMCVYGICVNFLKSIILILFEHSKNPAVTANNILQHLLNLKIGLILQNMYS